MTKELTIEQIQNIKKECKDLIEKSDKLHSFFSTGEFYQLDRENKDLLYNQFRLMNEYIQVLGKRMELLGVDDFLPQKTKEYPIWKPEIGNKCFYLKNNADVISCHYLNSSPFDDKLFYIGNVYKTKEAAQRMADRRKRIGIFENKMMEFAEGYEFDVGGYNYYVTYVKDWVESIHREQINPSLIYMTGEQAWKAVDWANEHYPQGL